MGNLGAEKRVGRLGEAGCDGRARESGCGRLEEGRKGSKAAKRADVGRDSRKGGVKEGEAYEGRNGWRICREPRKREERERG